MQLATAMNLRKAMDEETKRERFASWYSTLPGIPAHEKEIIERSLKYNVWKELIKLFVVYMILSLVWFFGAGRYDPFESVTGYSLIGKKSVIGVVQEDGESLRLKNPNKGEHVSYTLAELGMDPIILMAVGFRHTGKKKRMGNISYLRYCRKSRYRK
mgnify:CR=1 FL=1